MGKGSRLRTNGGSPTLRHMPAPGHSHPKAGESLTAVGGGQNRLMTTSVEELMQSLGAATMLASEVWRLWDVSRASPDGFD